VAATFTFIVDDAPAVTVLGENEVVTPAGLVPVDSVTLCADPDVTWVLTVAVAEEPGATVADDGETDTEKLLPPPPLKPVKMPVYWSGDWETPLQVDEA
jgi:hypothetical protein